MIATVLDGRAATVEFRLPRNGAQTILARVRAGDATSHPTPVLTDPALCTVSYSMTDRQKMDFLASASVKSKDWDHLGPQAGFAALAGWLKTQAGVADAYISETGASVLIELEDGDSLTIFNPKPGATAEPSPFRGATPAPASGALSKDGSNQAPAAASGIVKGLPASNRVICANFLEPYFPDSTSKVAGWFNSHGYAAIVKQMNTVPEVKAWFNNGPLGSLFIQAHGFEYPHKEGTMLAISLNQVTQETAEDVHYAEMRRTGELKIACERGKNTPVYGITRVFIRKHMLFSNHAVVVADTCNGANAELGKAFIDQGVGTYISWDWESGPQSVLRCEQIFDRLLGTNKSAPVSVPEERPFSMQAIQTWMTNKGYDLDPTTGLQTTARLKFRHHLTMPGHILRPAIRSIEYDNSPTQTMLKLTGDFGKDPGAEGKVFWGGREMHVAKWDQDEGITIDQLTVPLPVGDFEVRIRDRHKSNLTPMTEWTIPFTYEVKGNGTLKYNINGSYKVRFDVHGSRNLPEDPVNYPLVPFLNHADFTGTATASGQYVEPPVGEGGIETIHTWSGNRTLRSYDQGGTGNPENFLLCSAQLNTRTGVPLSFIIGASSYIDVSMNGFQIPPLTVTYDYKTMSMLPLVFDPADKWKLKGDIYRSDAALSIPQAVSASMTWPTITPQAYPDTKTAR